MIFALSAEEADNNDQRSPIQALLTDGRLTADTKKPGKAGFFLILFELHLEIFLRVDGHAVETYLVMNVRTR